MPLTPEEIAEDRAAELARLPERYNQTLPEIRTRFLNPYGYREALHTAHILQEKADSYLLEYPAIVFDEEAYTLAAQAWSYLFDLYQHIGRLEDDARTADEENRQSP